MIDTALPYAAAGMRMHIPDHPENMAYVTMPDGSRNEVFGPSQGLKLVIAANAPLMARIPIDPEIARLADSGGIEQYASREMDELVANFISVVPKAA